MLLVDVGLPALRVDDLCPTVDAVSKYVLQLTRPKQ